MPEIFRRAHRCTRTGAITNRVKGIAVGSSRGAGRLWRRFQRVRSVGACAADRGAVLAHLRRSHTGALPSGQVRARLVSRGKSAAIMGRESVSRVASRAQHVPCSACHHQPLFGTRAALQAGRAGGGSFRSSLPPASRGCRLTVGNGGSQRVTDVASPPCCFRRPAKLELNQALRATWSSRL